MNLLHRKATEAFPESPTYAQLAANFAGALVRWIASGFSIVPEATFDGRMDKCRPCESWNKDGARCMACGCLQVKQWLASERCPKGKWERTK